MNVAVVAHCDWSMDKKKRWMAAAIRDGARWQIHAPELVGDTSTLIDRMKARSVEKGALSDWYSVADHRSRISLHRPFYPARPGGTERAHLFNALGLTDPQALLRLCERATADRQAACMLFWTLGGNQVGKGAISGWREVIVPNLGGIGLWPFEGRLADLLDTKCCVIAETYPGDVYRQLGMPRGGWSKRRQVDRQRIAKIMIPWLSARSDLDTRALLPMIEDGFGADKAGEDRFDAVVGLFGMLDVVDGRRDEGVPDIDGVRRWEGWILGHHRNDAR